MPWPDIFIEHWISRHNHMKNKDEEIPCMQLNPDAMQTTTNIPDCIDIQQLQQAT